MNLTGEQRKKLELVRLQAEYRKKLLFAFDAKIIGSRPTPKQFEIINSKKNIHYIVASNRAGKSQLGARLVSWWFENNHPYMERPAKWGDGPITILMVGQVGEQMESALWEDKIVPFLKPGSYKIDRQGGRISRVVNRENGNRIIFISHNDAESARKKAQGYAAQVVWLDEMPSKVGVLNELRARIFDAGGFMYCTFTPLLRNNEIKKIVDRPSVRAHKWFISILDNPAFADLTQAEIIDEIRALSKSESEFNARMYGKWMSADTAVFMYDPEKNWKSPENYDPHIWPHVVVVDPAASGKAGLTVWAREPNADTWYCVMAKYLVGSAFSVMVPDVEKLVEPFNVVKRISDCNPSGFYKEARVQGITYIPITEKAYEKENMVDACNDAMCRQTAYLAPGSELLADELVTCERSEVSPDKILQASKYHTADTFRYFIRLKPRYETLQIEPRVEERLRIEWKKKLHSDAKRATTKMRKLRGSTRWARAR